MTFEELLIMNEPALERFVKFKISSKHDAEDVLQEVRLAAFRSFEKLRDESNFKAWLIGIARRKCADYFRSRTFDVSLDALYSAGSELSGEPEMSIRGLVYSPARLDLQDSPVLETLDLLPEDDRRILGMFYFDGLRLREIAERLNLSESAVKSRLYAARKRFVKLYPYKPKGGNNMLTKLPAIMPEYEITKSELPVFPVKWEEIMGWFIVPRLGERLEWAMYDFPKRNRTEYMIEEVTGRAEIHGIEGVSILCREYEPMENNRIDDRDYNERGLVAQLTDTHCRLLGERHDEGGVRKYYTFLDGDEFLDNWGFGEDNCGNEVNISMKGDITREGNAVTAKDKKYLLDVVGRYTVRLNGRTYDTVCVMDVENYVDDGVVTEQYLDKNGRTVLWRRFNKNDWRFAGFKKLWTEMLPDNETITVNGEIYVHWYDCITDYVL